jgi:hypothetical protein
VPNWSAIPIRAEGRLSRPDRVSRTAPPRAADHTVLFSGHESPTILEHLNQPVAVQRLDRADVDDLEMDTGAGEFFGRFQSDPRP